jgi:hypothetical protein
MVLNQPSPTDDKTRSENSFILFYSKAGSLVARTPHFGHILSGKDKLTSE